MNWQKNKHPVVLYKSYTNAEKSHGEIGEHSDSDYFQEILNVKIQQKASLRGRNDTKSSANSK